MEKIPVTLSFMLVGLSESTGLSGECVFGECSLGKVKAPDGSASVPCRCGTGPCTHRLMLYMPL